MTTVGGNNITLTAATLAGAIGTYIVRTPTADSNDTFDTAVNLILEYFGQDTTEFNQSTWEITIYNDSNFTITLNAGTGTTIFPSDPDTILPQTTKIYIFVQTAPSTLEVYQQSNGNSVAVSGIQLTDGNILVGSSTNIGTGVPLSGQASIINTGELTLTSSFLYDAVVDPAGGGDYTTLSAAITGGAIRIYLKSGTISESTNIVLPDGVRLVGESKYDSIIDFGTNDVGLVLSGGGAGVIDTISITSGTNTVTGTAFTGGMVGEYIILEETFYEIASVTPPTSLTLIKNYNGQTLTAEATTILPMAKGSFYNFSVRASGSGTGNLLNLIGTIDTIIKDVCFIDARQDAINAVGGGAIATTELLIESCIIDSPDRHGIIAALLFQSNILQCIIKNPVSNGINLDLVRNVIMNGLNITNCGSDGITVTNALTNEVIIGDTISDNGSGNGINIDASAVSVLIQACSTTNNALAGIVLNSINNIVGGCTIDLNGGNGITITATSSSNTITNNQITQNGDYGVDITSGAANNIISNNIIQANTTGQINDAGTDTTIMANQPTANVLPGTLSVGTSIATPALTIATESIAGVRAIFAYCSTTPAISGTVTQVPFDNTSISDTGYTLDTVTDIGQLTITDAGLYQITYEVVTEALDGTGTTRAAIKSDVRVDAAGGTSYTLITGSGSGGYMRELQGGNVTNYACGKTILANIVAGSTLIITFYQTSGTTTATLVANETTFSILRLRP